MLAKNTTRALLMDFFFPMTADTEVHTYAQIIFSEISEFHGYIQVRLWVL